MQWVSAMVERGAGHLWEYRGGLPTGEAKEGGYSSLGLFSELSTLRPIPTAAAASNVKGNRVSSSSDFSNSLW